MSKALPKFLGHWDLLQVQSPTSVRQQEPRRSVGGDEDVVLEANLECLRLSLDDFNILYCFDFFTNIRQVKYL